MKIDKEIQGLIPPLAEEEFEKLAEDIRERGCKIPLVVWKEEDILLDGHHRKSICDRYNIKYNVIYENLVDRNSAIIYVLKNQLRRRDLHPLIRIRLEETLERFESKRGQGGGVPSHKSVKKSSQDEKSKGVKSKSTSRKKVREVEPTTQKAKAVGVSTYTYTKGKYLLENVDENIIEKIIKGKSSIDKEYKKLKQEKRKEQKAKDLTKAQVKISKEAKENLSKVCDIRCCKMEELLLDIKPDCIITDPPYPKEFLPLYGKLAELSKDVPLVAAMCGQSYLPEIMEMMCKHLKYRWTIAYLMLNDTSTKQFQTKVNIRWKPVLVFGESVEWMLDICNSIKSEKEFHDWGQSESGMCDLITQLSKPNDLICDPFVGGGTTAVVALHLGRRFVGCDIDQESVDKSIGRCQEKYNVKK